MLTSGGERQGHRDVCNAFGTGSRNFFAPLSDHFIPPLLTFGSLLTSRITYLIFNSQVSKVYLHWSVFTDEMFYSGTVSLLEISITWTCDNLVHVELVVNINDNPLFISLTPSHRLSPSTNNDSLHLFYGWASIPPSSIV